MESDLPTPGVKIIRHNPPLSQDLAANSTTPLDRGETPNNGKGNRPGADADAIAPDGKDFEFNYSTVTNHRDNSPVWITGKTWLDYVRIQSNPKERGTWSLAKYQDYRKKAREQDIEEAAANGAPLANGKTGP
ncbi:MAG: hypothetical protein GY757_21230, partial [bacterium]|nr:hypothetical protein [bacterium]